MTFLFLKTTIFKKYPLRIYCQEPGWRVFPGYTFANCTQLPALTCLQSGRDYCFRTWGTKCNCFSECAFSLFLHSGDYVPILFAKVTGNRAGKFSAPANRQIQNYSLSAGSLIHFSTFYYCPATFYTYYSYGSQ